MFYLAFIALKFLAYALSLLPRVVFLSLGHFLGFLLRVFHFREEVTEKNIELAFPELTKEARATLQADHYRELGVLFLELLRLFFKFDRFVERNCDVEGESHLRAALAEGNGAFVMTAHLGNWEVLAASVPTLLGTKVTMVTKELKPKIVHRLIEVTRALLGITMACEPRTMPGIVRALKRKELVGFVMDQYTGAPVGARVPFFGIPVGSHTALATLALRMKVPVVPAIAIRKPGGRYLVRFEPKLHLEERADSEQSIIANTALFVRHTEKWVREFPAQWLWIHRRWKGDLSPLAPQVEGEMLR